MNKQQSGETKGLSRRGFLKGAALATAGVASAATLAACSSGDPGMSAAPTAWEPAKWDAETEILVVGYGGAGISAGISAKHESLGEVLVIEAAPEGEQGGNTRVSAQVIFIPDSVEGAIKYQSNLNGPYKVKDDLLEAWATNICENEDWFEAIGIDIAETMFFNPEWPDVEGSEHCRCFLVGDGMGYQQLWNELERVATELEVPVKYDTRMRRLVINPHTGEVAGVLAESSDGTETYIKAKKGVVLSCGGFENNPDMIRSFFQIGYYETCPYGTPYNRGDGILAAQAAGAELWNMNSFANSGFGIKAAGLDFPSQMQPTWKNKDYIYVGPDGKRFMYEEMGSLARHGKYMYNGAETNLRQPAPMHAIFGSKTFNGDCIIQDFICGWIPLIKPFLGTTNQEFLDAQVIVKGDTPEELAKKIGYDPAVLKATIDGYNAGAAAGDDPEYNRGTDVYSAFNYGAQGAAAAKGESEIDNSDSDVKPSIAAFALDPLAAPYYAVQLRTITLNTQGGPKRGANGEVLNGYGEAIPRLYAAGEMGTIYAYNYNGGGNVSEAISSGRLAARSISALSAWDA
jgi:succinate dehydrogenase/fumarate reductase flavoprotein subunit